MQTLARGGYTAAQVKAALHAPNRTMNFRYELLDSQNRLKSVLSNVLSGFVQNNALASIKRTARFSLHDDGMINFLNDRIKPYVRLWIPPGRVLARYYSFLQASMPAEYETIRAAPESGGWVEWPLGVFVLSTPNRTAQASGSAIRAVEAYDLLQVLIDDKVDDRYTVTAGTNYITAIRSLLSSAGFTTLNLTPTNKTLPADRDWYPGTRKLEIVNDLAGAINHRSLIIDEDGVPVSRPYESPVSRASEYTYIDDDQSVLFPEVEHSLDLFSVPNKWIRVVSEPDRPAIVGSYTNTNPSSPTSTVNRGRTIVDYLEQLEAADQASLDAQVQRLAFEASQVYESVSFQTAVMPHHSDSDVLTLTYSALGVSAKYSEVSWEYELKAGARMTHRIRRVVSV